MDKKLIRAKIREVKELQRKASAKFREISQSLNDQDYSSVYDLMSETGCITVKLFESLSPEKSEEIGGFIPYRIVGDYVIFMQRDVGYHSMAGWQSGEKLFVAVHGKTGKIRKESFLPREAHGWWMNLLKTDDGKATDEEWRELIRKDAMRRLHERIKAGKL